VRAISLPGTLPRMVVAVDSPNARQFHGDSLVLKPSRPPKVHFLVRGLDVCVVLKNIEKLSTLSWEIDRSDPKILRVSPERIRVLGERSSSS